MLHGWGNIKRTILLRGSKSNTIAVWTTSVILSLIWIYQSEKSSPSHRGFFFRRNDAPEFTKHEIQEWNRKYRPKSNIT